MFDNFDIIVGASNDLPELILKFGETEVNVFGFLNYEGMTSLINWIKDIAGFGIIAGTCLNFVGNVAAFLSGEARLIHSEAKGG